MTFAPARRRGVWACALVLSACGGSGELIVLAPNPEDGSVGEAVVSAGGASVELTRAGEGTQVAPGTVPSAPSQIPADEVEGIFGSALEALPLPPRLFRLYFESGSDVLTDESVELLPDIVALARERPAADLSVIGHTDRTGDAGANYELGLTRARVILDVLADAGVDASLIEVGSHGEADPLVPTADGVAEARNRRVEVTIR